MSDIPEKPPASTNSTYKVGYCKPPEKGKFKKGKSGNPSGRPRKEKKPETTAEIHEQEMSELYPLRVNGEVVKLSARRLIYKKLKQNAFDGCPRAIKELLRLEEKYAAFKVNVDEHPYGVLVVGPRMTEEEFEEKAAKTHIPHWKSPEEE